MMKGLKILCFGSDICETIQLSESYQPTNGLTWAGAGNATESGIREAVLYQIGCFFTHLLNSP